ncbi:MAG: UDP-3-O-acyl-N-acetylglucosamine deacetylase [Acidobacteriota bacterium]|nr:UDP-3-O-acyl-N-acetylglucosamine deacetylase [Acidobacteriota bacterium]
MHFQQTLRRSVTCAGIGLHSGHKVSLSLKAGLPDSGIRFRRADLGGHEIPAMVKNVSGIHYATGLEVDSASVETVEHLLAALISMGVDNVIIELNQREVPIMDGSAAPFVYLVQEAGTRRQAKARRFLKVTRPISLSMGDKQIALYPSEHFKITYSISFDHPLLEHQSREIQLNKESFIDQIAPARTFGFLKEVERLRRQGLALGGSLDNAIVLSESGVLNRSLRFEDEFVRHKILDAIGDLALVGYPLIGHLVVNRGGHALHTALASMVLEKDESWELVESTVDAATGAPALVPVKSTT